MVDYEALMDALIDMHNAALHTETVDGTERFSDMQRNLYRAGICVGITRCMKKLNEMLIFTDEKTIDEIGKPCVVIENAGGINLILGDMDSRDGIVCPICDNWCDSDARFCSDCGTYLGERE